MIKNEKTPYVLYTDNQTLGSYSHVPHFIIVEKKIGDNFCIFDPWTGGRKKINISLLNKAIIDLREHIKYCPLLIKIK